MLYNECGNFISSANNPVPKNNNSRECSAEWSYKEGTATTDPSNDLLYRHSLNHLSTSTMDRQYHLQ
jgi:hypothetical protein